MYDVTMWQEYFEYFQHVWYLIHTIILNSRMMSQGGKNGRKGPLNVRSSSVTRRPTVSDDIFSSSVSRIVRWNTCREWYLSYCCMLLFFSKSWPSSPSSYHQTEAWLSWRRYWLGLQTEGHKKTDWISRTRKLWLNWFFARLWLTEISPLAGLKSPSISYGPKNLVHEIGFRSTIGDLYYYSFDYLRGTRIEGVINKYSWTR